MYVYDSDFHGRKNADVSEISREISWPMHFKYLVYRVENDSMQTYRSRSVQKRPKRPDIVGDKHQHAILRDFGEIGCSSEPHKMINRRCVDNVSPTVRSLEISPQLARVLIKDLIQEQHYRCILHCRIYRIDIC